MTNLRTAFQAAKKLQTHIQGQLQPHYVGDTSKNFTVVYTDDDSPASLFEANKFNFRGGWPKMWVSLEPTKRDDGTMRPQNEWRKVLLSRKKWQRTPTEVKEVAFDIVGLKRVTSKLPSGVLVRDIKFSV